MDYTHRLDEHLKRWEQGQEEVVEVPKGYLKWLKAENERLREAMTKCRCWKCPHIVDALKAGENDEAE